MSRHLVIVGGGHAHLTVLLKLHDYIQRGFRVSVVSPSPYHYYSGMGPGLLAGTYRPQEARFHVRKMAEDRGAAFVHDSVIRIDARAKALLLSSGERLTYDVVSFNTGSKVHALSRSPEGDQAFTVKPISELLDAQQTVLDAIRRREASIVVVGGGPAGVEMAGNLWRLVHDRGCRARIALVAGSMILSGFPDRVRRMALASFGRRAIEVRVGVYAVGVGKGGLELSNGERVPADVVITATGIVPSSLFRESGLPTCPDGGLLVNRFLQCVSCSEIFGGGDCISFEPRPLAKVGVHAVRQNKVLHHNLLAALTGGTLAPFHPQRAYLLILNLGDDRAILTRGNFAWDGRFPWLLKDRIDRSFMRRFQVSGERDEQSL
jgi:NADH dehydrogenase FAD-containing subunit